MTSTALAIRPIAQVGIGRTRVEGLYFLLCQEIDQRDYVSRYNEAEMDELFSLEQRAQLEAGETIRSKFGTRLTDMVAAARTAAQN